MALGLSLSCALACLIALPGAGEAQPASATPAAATVSATGQSQEIFPTPRHVEAAKGHLDLTAGIRIVAPPGDAAASRIAGIFAQWTDNGRAPCGERGGQAG